MISADYGDIEENEITAALSRAVSFARAGKSSAQILVSGTPTANEGNIQQEFESLKAFCKKVMAALQVEGETLTAETMVVTGHIFKVTVTAK